MDERPLLTLPAIRALEAQALAASAPGTLMARAADAVAEVAAAMLRRLPARTPVLALAGPGNNGGDALLAAMRLAGRGWSVDGLALVPDGPAAADAARVRRQWQDAGRGLATPADLDRLLQHRPLVLDGLFGIGLARALPPAASAIAMRLAETAVTVVAVDVPSGLDADRGAIVGPPGSIAVRADATVTMIADKPGLHTGVGPVFAGAVHVASLGVDAFAAPPDPARTASAAPAIRGRAIDRGWARAHLVPRARDAHKGRFGDVLVVAGDGAMRGAALLAALGAQAVGAGRITLGTADGDPLSTRAPELMTRRLHPAASRAESALGPATAIVIGCGLGRGAAARAVLGPALTHPAALVVDADGLNRIAETPGLRSRLCARAGAARATVLTPHPLEAARLLGTSTTAVQADRLAAACSLAAATGAVVVLKGAGTVVAEPDGRWSVNASGGPILSVAGTGDVLAGTIGGLLATGMHAADAARLGAWLHGAAADTLAASPQWSGSVGLPASTLAASIAAEINRPDVRCAA